MAVVCYGPNFLLKYLIINILSTVESQLYVSQLYVLLVCTSNWYSLVQNTLHGVISKIIFTCTSLSVLRPNF